jgi:hypothetical protein
MIARLTAGAFGLISVLMVALAPEAFAQFDAQHDHLKCYKIKGGAIVTKVQTDNQFGREMIFKLVPQFLCAPTQKTCLATDGSCGKPGGPSGDPVRHFKCYKVAAKQCPSNDCTKLTGRFAPVPAELIDQFGDEHVTVGVPKMLCAPVEKIVTSGTTTTTSTSTTSCPITTTTFHVACGQLPPSSCGGGDCPRTATCIVDMTGVCSCSGPPPPCGPDVTTGTCGGTCSTGTCVVIPSGPCEPTQCACQ